MKSFYAFMTGLIVAAIIVIALAWKFILGILILAMTITLLEKGWQWLKLNRRPPMKIVETVITEIDWDTLEETIKTSACPKEMPFVRRCLNRLKKEGTLFLHKGPRNERESILFKRFKIFVELSVVKKHLTCEIKET